eukprot:14362830-Alexandrium_andersonii.AAC.1
MNDHRPVARRMPDAHCVDHRPRPRSLHCWPFCKSPRELRMSLARHLGLAPPCQGRRCVGSACDRRVWHDLVVPVPHRL